MDTDLIILVIPSDKIFHNLKQYLLQMGLILIKTTQDSSSLMQHFFVSISGTRESEFQVIVPTVTVILPCSMHRGKAFPTYTVLENTQ